jgi:DNA-binding CsgD family transcriptional regulator
LNEETRQPHSGHASVGPPRHDRRRQSSDPLLIAARHIADTHPHALFILSHEGAVLFTNVAARRLSLERTKVFHIRKHRLLIRGKPVDEWFGAPLGAHEKALLIRPAVAETGARREYQVLVSRTSLRRARDPVAVVVYERHRLRSLAQSLLQQLYDLTPSESATAAQLFRGLRPTQVAKALGISVHTVRSHAKRVFTKCHVRSQSELVHLLALGPGIE